MRYFQRQQWKPLTSPWRLRFYFFPRHLWGWPRPTWSKWATHWQVGLFLVRWSLILDIRRTHAKASY